MLPETAPTDARTLLSRETVVSTVEGFEDDQRTFNQLETELCKKMDASDSWFESLSGIFVMEEILKIEGMISYFENIYEGTSAGNDKEWYESFRKEDRNNRLYSVAQQGFELSRPYIDAFEQYAEVRFRILKRNAEHDKEMKKSGRDRKRATSK